MNIALVKDLVGIYDNIEYPIKDGCTATIAISEKMAFDSPIVVERGTNDGYLAYVPNLAECDFGTREMFRCEILARINLLEAGIDDLPWREYIDALTMLNLGGRMFNMKIYSEDLVRLFWPSLKSHAGYALMRTLIEERIRHAYEILHKANAFAVDNDEAIARVIALLREEEPIPPAQEVAIKAYLDSWKEDLRNFIISEDVDMLKEIFSQLSFFSERK